MDNIKLADEFLEIEENNKEVWIIEDDLSADWCIDRIKDVELEYKNFEDVANAKIKQIKDKLQEKRKEADNERSFFDWKLREYFNKLKHKETKTLKKYDLPSGKLKLKKSRDTFNYDKNKLLDIAKTEDELKGYIKIETKEAFEWGEFKKKLDIIGGQIINKDTGEIVDLEGLEITKTPEKFEIEY